MAELPQPDAESDLQWVTGTRVLAASVGGAEGASREDGELLARHFDDAETCVFNSSRELGAYLLEREPTVVVLRGSLKELGGDELFDWLWDAGTSVAILAGPHDGEELHDRMPAEKWPSVVVVESEGRLDLMLDAYLRRLAEREPFDEGWTAALAEARAAAGDAVPAATFYIGCGGIFLPD